MATTSEDIIYLCIKDVLLSGIQTQVCRGCPICLNLLSQA